MEKWKEEAKSGIDVISFKGISPERIPEATAAEGAINNSARKLHFKTARVSFSSPSPAESTFKELLQHFCNGKGWETSAEKHSPTFGEAMPPSPCRKLTPELRIYLAAWGIQASDTTWYLQAGPQLIKIVISCLTSAEVWAFPLGRCCPWGIVESFVKVKLMKM